MPHETIDLTRFENQADLTSTTEDDKTCLTESNLNNQANANEAKQTDTYWTEDDSTCITGTYMYCHQLLCSESSSVVGLQHNLSFSSFGNSSLNPSIGFFFVR